MTRSTAPITRSFGNRAARKLIEDLLFDGASHLRIFVIEFHAHDVDWWKDLADGFIEMTDPATS